jgi:cobalt-zinc-cadmium efflux system protein
VSQSRRLSIVLALNVALIAGLVVAGLLLGSLSLLAAAADSVADSFALGLGLLAVHLRDRRGRAGATNLVALVNVSVLLAVSAAVEIEAVSRLLAGSPPVAGAGVLTAALVNAAVLGVGVLVLGRGAGREDLHMRSVLLDTAADGATAGAVAVVGAVIAIADGLYWLDPVAGGLIALVVAVGAIRLLADVVRALRRRTVVAVDRD